jgi:hypothetical protein
MTLRREPRRDDDPLRSEGFLSIARAPDPLRASEQERQALSPAHCVPNVPAIRWRTDVSVHGQIVRIRDAPVTGRAGVGFTLLGGKHVIDAIIAPTDYVLNALASARWRFVELVIETYNVLGPQYPDAHLSSGWLRGQHGRSSLARDARPPPRGIVSALDLVGALATRECTRLAACARRSVMMHHGARRLAYLVFPVSVSGRHAPREGAGGQSPPW